MGREGDPAPVPWGAADFSSERTRANFALVPTVQMANGAIRAEHPVGSRRSDGPVGFAGPYGRNLMQAPPRIRVGSEFFCGTSGLPIRAFRACGCCWPMPRTSPQTPLPRARSSLWPWQYATDALLLVHTVLLQHPLEMPIAPVKCPGP